MTVSIFLANTGDVKLNALRSLRVLRPLKTISSIEGLRVLMVALLSAIPLLRDTIIILLFFFGVFAIAGLQTMSGNLMKRCFNPKVGMIPYQDDILCKSDEDCGQGQICGKGTINPNLGITNFDTIFFALLTIFQSVTLEGWSTNMLYVQQTTSYLTFMYFVPLVFIGAFFLLNLTLAVINSKFNETHKQYQIQAKKDEEEKKINNKKKINKLKAKKLLEIGPEDERLNFRKYLVGKKAAQKMIGFLRLRQEQKRKDRATKLKLQSLQQKRGRSKIFGFIMNNKNFEEKKEKNSSNDSSNSSENSNSDSDSKSSKQNGIINQFQSNDQLISVLDRNIPPTQDHTVSQITLAKLQKLQNKEIDQELENKRRLGQKENKQNLDQREFERFFTENDAKVGFDENIIENINESESFSSLYEYSYSNPYIQKDNKQKKHSLYISSIDNYNSVKSSIDQINFQQINQDYKKIKKLSDFKTLQLKQDQERTIDKDDIVKKDLNTNIISLDLTQNEPKFTNNNISLMSLMKEEDNFIKLKPRITNTLKLKMGDIVLENKKVKDGKTFVKKNAILPNHYDSPELFQKQMTEMIEKGAKKLKIKKDFQYISPSMNDVLENRLKPFEPAPDLNMVPTYDFKLVDFQPYQIKMTYKLMDDKKNENILNMLNDESIPLEEQPFETVTSIGLWGFLHHLPTEQICYKSDQIVTGTLNFTLQPRKIKRHQEQEQEERELNQQNKSPKNRRYKKFPSSFDQRETFAQKAIIDVSDFQENQKRAEEEKQDEQDMLSEDFMESDEWDDYVNQQYKKAENTKQKLKKQLTMYQNSPSHKKKESLNVLEVSKLFSNLVEQVNKGKSRFQSRSPSPKKGLNQSFSKAFKERYLKQEAEKIQKRVLPDFLNLQNILQNKNTSEQQSPTHAQQKILRRRRERIKKFNIQDAKKYFDGEFIFSDEEVKPKNQINLEQMLGDQEIELDNKFSDQFEAEAKRILTYNYPEQDYEKKLEYLRLIAIRDPKRASELLQNQMEEIEREKILEQQKLHKKQESMSIMENLSEIIPDSYRSEIGKLTVRKEEKKPQKQEQDKLVPQKKEEKEEDDSVTVEKLKEKDWARKKISIEWSGQEVLGELINQEKSKRIISELNKLRVWPKGLKGYWFRFRIVLKSLVVSSFFEQFMTISVLINTITLAMDRYNIPKAEEDLFKEMNFIFTIIFIFELVFKVAALGLKRHLSDTMNYMDGIIVLLSIIELGMNSASKGNGDGGGSSLQAFRTVRIFRTFRVLRVTRLLRAMKSMQVIMGVIQRSIKSFFYITVLMFLFVYIYALLGINIIGDLNATKFNDGTYEHQSRANFDKFSNAFITTFQILTMENWQTVLYDTMYFSGLPKPIIAIYLISWIFIGNFILLNLFLAILLDSFLEEEEEEEMEEQQEQEKQQKIQKGQKNQKDKPSFVKKTNEKKNFKEFINLLNPKSKDANFLDDIENINDLDDDEILALIKNDGQKDKQKTEAKDIDIFEEVECKISIYLFTKTNKFRRFMMRLFKHTYFERFILFLIITSSIKLAVDSYTSEYPEDSIVSKVSLYFDYTFTALFTLEALIKVIALGFIFEKGSYLRESWNILDFFIVVTTLLDISVQSIELPVLKILRLLRTLRPLRFISHNKAMKTIVTALIESVGAIINVMVVVLIVWLMFAILGVSFFGGKFFYCTVNIYKAQDEVSCLNQGGEWKRYDSNFDDVIQAMMTLYIVASLENWPSIMYQAIDAQGIDMGPKENSSFFYSFYFIAFILIGTFFFLNFFIGVLFLNFKQAQNDEKTLSTDPVMDRLYHNWKDIQIMILEASPDFETTNVPKNKKRKIFHRIVTSNKFDIFIMVFIFLNMIQMMCYFEGASASYVKFLDDINLVFTAVFTVEAILKLIAFGKTYFQMGWNKFDFAIVIASLGEILLSVVSSGDKASFLKFGPQIARVLRVFRISRVLRLVGKYKGIQALISTIMFSLPSLFNVFSLLFLILFIFSILAVFMFKDVLYGDSIEPTYNNFKNFANALLTLFRVATGEDWNNVMYDCLHKENCKAGTNCVNPFTPMFYIVFILVCTYVMLNLFILVICQQFDTYYLPKDNIFVRFKTDLETFKNAWKKISMKRYNCQKIRDTQVTKFLRELKEPLGLGAMKSDQQVKMIMIKMGIRNEKGYIYFNELLYRVMKRAYGQFKLSKQMQVLELRTLYQIELKTLKESTQSSYGGKLEDLVIKNLLVKDKNVNPFLTMMFMKVSYQTWRNMAIKKKKMVQEQENQVSQGSEVGGLIEDFNAVTYVEVSSEEIVVVEEEDSLYIEESKGGEFEFRSQDNSVEKKVIDLTEQENEEQKQYVQKMQKSASQGRKLHQSQKLSSFSKTDWKKKRNKIEKFEDFNIEEENEAKNIQNRQNMNQLVNEKNIIEEEEDEVAINVKLGRDNIEDNF